ncbi:MAG: Abi family protein [Sedimentibacter sp.]|uniref:Abi family protein n=1 Tax=Sedimentibacter sp. TaxID=1960295 RepID=UPI00298282AF|nr:Abi family protein [Sedimentibacter sp.]MDW5298851.1 Abi family protein [Sedimentibacter sp.]
MSDKTKPFKTIEEQITLLEQRGLIIDDKAETERALSHYNYYRLSGYTLTLRKEDKFFKDVKMSDVMQIYNFDAELRALLLYLLEYIEVSFRTYVGYCHSKKYGPLGYKNSKNFTDSDRFFKFQKDLNEAIKENERSEIFIQHHKNKYDGDFPIWVVVELLSFGTLSRLFKNLNWDVQKEICKSNYNKITEEYIENWLQGFTILRNICAHRGRIYNKNINFALRLSNKDKKEFINSGLEIQKISKRLFIYLFVAKKLVLDNNVWFNFIDKLEKLLEKYPFVDIAHYGFPKNWMEYITKV